MKILAIESSCDETAAAVVTDGPTVLSSVVSSSIDLHTRFGGVVPEVASRAHVEAINPVITQALAQAGMGNGDKPDVVAATIGPGLIGALLVGVSAAKGLALGWGVPFIGINHMEGHLYASWLERTDIETPLITLLVSGNHSMIVLIKSPGDYEILGETIDDAAGEAFDKVARALGFPYPGGPHIDKAAEAGDPQVISFPRAMPGDNFDFSFSGVKTSVMNYLRKNPDFEVADVAASFQAAVVDVLITKAFRAVEQTGARGLALGGGVAANSALRAAAEVEAARQGVELFLPSRSMCTDNAAMIGAAALFRFATDGPSGLEVPAVPRLRLAAAQ